ncbi:hypothetical protein BU17DRAFT_68127 [Hysterangium stoloniferum]|nr:hypothetical protein BU17DRAFT_68127 [Hysterangium stoloniferum]
MSRHIAFPDTPDNELLVQNHFPNACSHWKTYSHAHIHKSYKIIGLAQNVITITISMENFELMHTQGKYEVKHLKAFHHPYITALIHQVGVAAKDSPARLATRHLASIMSKKVPHVLVGLQEELAWPNSPMEESLILRITTHLRKLRWMRLRIRGFNLRGWQWGWNWMW